MTRASEGFVRQELVGLDDLELADVMALHATEAEVLEARAWVEGDEEVVRMLEGPSTGRVARLVDIARAAAEREEDADDRR